MRKARYIVTEPVEGGYAWWSVIDRQSDVMENFAVATFSRYLPHAEREAKRLCARLNRETAA